MLCHFHLKDHMMVEIILNINKSSKRFSNHQFTYSEHVKYTVRMSQLGPTLRPGALKQWLLPSPGRGPALRISHQSSGHARLKIHKRKPTHLEYNSLGLRTPKQVPKKVLGGLTKTIIGTKSLQCIVIGAICYVHKVASMTILDRLDKKICIKST